MKRQLLFFLYAFLPLISFSQEIFTSDFVLNLPFPLLTIEDQLYVGLFEGSTNAPAGISRLNYDDPSTFEVVSTNEQVGQGPLYITFDPVNNRIYGTLPTFFFIDLDDNLPTQENVIDINGLPLDTNGGLTYSDGFIYFVDIDENLYRLSTEDGASPEPIFTFPDATNVVIAQILNNELYYFKYNDEIDVDLMKIDIVNPSDEVLVSNNTEFSSFVQSSHITNNTLFVGIDTGTQSPSIYQYDLSQDLPLSPTAIDESIIAAAVLGITSYQNDLYFSDTQSRNIFRLESAALNLETATTNRFSLFPNPTNEVIFVRNQINDEFDYAIYDTLGKLVAQGSYNSSGISVDQLSNGLYIIEIQKNSGINTITETIKFVKN